MRCSRIIVLVIALAAFVTPVTQYQDANVAKSVNSADYAVT